ncbi:MAG: TonB-dependent receptor plug domain-containing protein [Candidatus Binatia bacterium]
MKIFISQNFTTRRNRGNARRNWPCRQGPSGFTFIAFALVIFASEAFAQIQKSIPPTSMLKKLSIEELMDIEVTSVSKRPEKLSETASAIQVITQEDIRRSGATSLPEALRLAPNLQVAQVNASQWAISARGFNNVLANKLLVMIDGRTVYTPLYAGVFWDVQDTLLEDVDRIEVISGPGGTLWGANAVNGVINITTKSAKETPGLFIEGGTGTDLHGFGGIRYGGQLAPHLYYRVYGKAFSRDDTTLVNGSDAQDAWPMGQGGFRLDWDPDEKNLLTLQADFYDGRPNPDGGTPVVVRGGNALGRWTHTISEGSDFQLQLYYDRTWRNFGSEFTEDLGTYDVNWQHRFQFGQRQEVIWGLGFRLMDDTVDNLPLLAFRPGHKTLSLYSAFVQDEITLIEDRLRLTLGSKFEHNDYTGFEFQPSGRLAWTLTRRQTIWAAISRAVRTPSRIDRDFFLFIAPTIPAIMGNSDFASEELLAYELGWRLQPSTKLSVSLATFYNEYDNVRSAEPGPPPLNIPIVFSNGVRGETYGVELAAVGQLTDWWRLRGGYTFLQKHLSAKPSSHDLNQGTAESNDPEHQFLVQSSMDLSDHFELDAVIRYVDALPQPHVPSYVSLDVRLGWKLTRYCELAIVGQNLLDGRHPEFVPSSPSPREIERSVYGKVTWRF